MKSPAGERDDRQNEEKTAGASEMGNHELVRCLHRAGRCLAPPTRLRAVADERAHQADPLPGPVLPGRPRLAWRLSRGDRDFYP